MTREAEAARVRIAVRVEDEHVGLDGELVQRRENGRHLAKGEQTRDVRKRHRPFPRRLIHDV